MPTLDENFDELRVRLKQREMLHERSAEPIYYLVFSPREMQTVKRRLSVWKSKLESRDGWTVRVLSLGRRVQDFLSKHKNLPLWLKYEHSHPGDYDAARKTLVAQLADTGVVTTWVRETLGEAEKEQRGLVILSDIEGIHPFLRIGAVEQSLQGSCPVPLVILYPGVSSGSTILKFLGEYPEDGNYRSLMVGG